MYIPILFLTAKVKPEDRIKGFREGADDYLCKPFNVDELILRIRAILRRTKPKWQQTNQTGSSSTQLELGSYILEIEDYRLDTRSFEFHIPERGKIRLTPLQFDILYHLMTHPGETFSPARLLDEVWDYPSGKGSPDLVPGHTKTIRKEIKKTPQAPNLIRSIPGHEYRF